MLLSDKFICAGEEYGGLRKRVPAPFFKKNITINESLKSAEITVCGLGFYELYMNGKCITKGRLSPYITNPDEIVFYDNYDIKELFKDGKNEIRFLLGNGMQNAFGGHAWDFQKASFRSSPKLAFAIELCFENGKKEIIEADDSVLTTPSKIISDDIRMGEFYDATFAGQKWKKSLPTSAPKGEKRLSIAKPIRYEQEISPVKIWKEGKAYIYDFGINTAGVCRLNIDARENQKVKLTFGEILDDGKFFYQNTAFCHTERKYYQQDTYICKEGKNQWIPTFTYHGFRYVKVEGVTKKQATPELLTYLTMNTELGSVGYFVCDDEQINTLHKMTLNSTKSNFHHFPTDCPQREKNGWTADAALSSEHTLLFYEPTDNYKQWLVAICKAQRKDGALPGIVPTAADWGYEKYNGPAWDCVLVELPYQIWQKRNDISAFEICTDSIIKYIKYLETKFNSDGLLEFGLGDWCPPHDPVKAPLVLTDSIEAFDIADKSAKMFNKIGDTLNAKYCQDFADNMRNKIREHLFDKERCVFAGNCQTSQAMGIYYNIINEDEKKKAFAALLATIQDCDYHIDTGVLGGRVIFHVLAENGEMETAMKILKNPTAPSYIQWIDEGSTALREDFVVGNMTCSYNHHFWGNISAFFLDKICGIQVHCDKITINPNLPEHMNYATGEFNSVFGTIKVTLNRKEDKVITKVDCPSNTPVKTSLQPNYVLEKA